jgi:hypothetical protein
VFIYYIIAPISDINDDLAVLGRPAGAPKPFPIGIPYQMVIWYIGSDIGDLNLL